MQYKSGLVSVITPCYNVENYVSKLLDSLLIQDYPYIEIIAVDDGSTDATVEVLLQYIDRFKNKGYKYKIIKQNNGGQSSAINNGLHYIAGEYLVWPDSDDYYLTKDAISKLVMRMKSLPSNYAMVRAQELVVRDDESHEVLERYGLNAKEFEDTSLFFDCVYQKNGYYYTPGTYMIKTKAFFECSKMPIYTSHDAGQNYQLMLPILYHYRCSTILEPLYAVTRRCDSHSMNIKNYEKIICLLKTYQETLIGTINNINRMSFDIKSQLVKDINAHYCDLLLNEALMHNIDADIKQYRKLQKENRYTLNNRTYLKYLLYQMGLQKTCSHIKGMLLSIFR